MGPWWLEPALWLVVVWALVLTVLDLTRRWMEGVSLNTRTTKRVRPPRRS